MFDKKTEPNRLERLMMAVTFAEAGEHDTALEMMAQKPAAKRQEKHLKRRQEKRADQRPVLMA
jgi:hypothetical protein